MRTLYHQHLYAFKGWDWSELPRSWGWRISKDCGEDDDLLERVRQQLGEISESSWQSTRAHRHMPLKRAVQLAQARAFSRQFEKVCNERGTKPLWAGLAAMKDNMAFLKYLGVLLPDMWS